MICEVCNEDKVCLTTCAECDLKVYEKERKQGALEVQNKSNLIILDLLCQACDYDDVKGIIDNQCISAYEDACDYLEKQKILRELNPRAYKLNRKRIKELEGR